MDTKNFYGGEARVFSPHKVLVIGTMGSGKTTLAEYLARDTGFPFASIDGCRIHYGDGTVSGEDRAWDMFLACCRRPSPGILEFSGGGPHAFEVRENLLCSSIPVLVPGNYFHPMVLLFKRPHIRYRIRTS